MDLCTKLSDKVLDLENLKNAQALEIQKLKKIVKKLEKTQGSAPVTTADVSVSTAEPSTPTTTTTTTTITLIEDEDLTIAQTLMKMKNDVQAMMDADYELAIKLQEHEREELTIEERSKLFVELMNERKKHFARLRAEEQRRKPPTKTQKRNLMSTYLKNMVGYKHTQLKNKNFEEIQMLFEKEMKRVNIFVDMDAELVKGSKIIKSEVDRAAPKLAAGSSKRDVEEELNQESSKRQKTGESSELAEEPRDKEVDELSQEELQQIMIIVPEQGMNVAALQTKDDLVILWSLVKEKFNSTELTDDKEREIWVELKILFEPDIDDEL
ncbi:hypothetical protein Tco_1515323 [Tanacetum coccineum]